MSKKVNRQFKKVVRTLEEWGFDVDDPIIGKNKAYAELEFGDLIVGNNKVEFEDLVGANNQAYAELFEDLDFAITLKKDGKSWKKDLSSIEVEADGYGIEFGILWEFDDIKIAANSIGREIESGAYGVALVWLGTQDYSRFNDYIEGIAGFSNAEIVVNGSTFL